MTKFHVLVLSSEGDEVPNVDFRQLNLPDFGQVGFRFGIAGDLLNFSNCKEDTTPVGSYKNGISPYGIYDLAGNVWEWVNSLYGTYPYIGTYGSKDSDNRVLRGGAWSYSEDELRVSNRFRNFSNSISSYIGFRCVRLP